MLFLIPILHFADKLISLPPTSFVDYVFDCGVSALETAQVE
jgi:hypothetical protein